MESKRKSPWDVEAKSILTNTMSVQWRWGRGVTPLTEWLHCAFDFVYSPHLTLSKML